MEFLCHATNFPNGPRSVIEPLSGCLITIAHRLTYSMLEMKGLIIVLFLCGFVSRGKFKFFWSSQNNFSLLLGNMNI